MKKCILLLWVVLFSCTTFADQATNNTATAPKGETLKLVTFNIRFFGLGGTMSGTPQQENRDTHLRNYLASELSGTDVFFFQEIVDVQRLVKNVVPKGMKCLSYEAQSNKHQYVVICLSSKYRFYEDPRDQDNIINEVSIDGMQKSRPALHILVKNSAGKTVLRLVGVHLKAFPAEYATRTTQIESIARFLKPLERFGVPTVLGGDFNSYEAKDSGAKLDDNVAFTNVFKKQKVNLVESQNVYKYTFRSDKHRNKLDRFWLSKNIKTVQPAKVHGPCNDNRATGKGLSDPTFFYNNISDHCPVSVTIRL